ncbi:MAG TPA: DUF2064 domain-containing protein [Candidatus Deferrimicrobium sp.]|nr:DUF2064 domain-containing protein [Candidatus Deferrimicrobium sp.]
MPQKKQNDSVIAICVQELFEDGSCMDFGAIQGDNLQFLHQAFITDSITSSLRVSDTDVRLYSINVPERQRLIKIITTYLKRKLTGDKAESYADRFLTVEIDHERWGSRIERVFADCFAGGYKHVLVVGSRTPTIRPSMMETALRMLSQSDAVFGPTPEGRYYSIGMSGSYQISLSEFDWKSPLIYSEVAEAFSQKRLEWSELEIWYAVETAADLEIMVRDINQFRYEGDEETARETELVMERILAKLG